MDPLNDIEDVLERIRVLAAAERLAMPGASRAQRVGHKAAAEAYDTVLVILVPVVEAMTSTEQDPASTS